MRIWLVVLVVVLLCGTVAFAQSPAPDVPPMPPPRMPMPIPPVIMPDAMPAPPAPGASSPHRTDPGAAPQNGVPYEPTGRIEDGWRLIEQGRLREALEWFEQRGDGLEARLGRADALDLLGEYDRAREELEACAPSTLAPEVAADVRNRLGIVYWEMGRLDDALKTLADAERQAREAKSDGLLARILNNRGLVLVDAGRLDDAWAAYGEAVGIHRRDGNVRGEAIVLNNQALARLAQDKPAHAESLAEKASALEAAAPDPLLRTEIRETQARILLRLGRAKEAEGAFAVAVEAAEAIGDLETLWQAQAGMGRALRALGKRKQAITWLQDSVKTIARLQAGVSSGGQQALLSNKQDVFRDLVDLLLKEGRTIQALEIEEMARSAELSTRFHQAGSHLADPSRQASLDQAQSLLSRSQALSRELATAQSSAGADPQQVARLREEVARARMAFSSLADALDKDQDPTLAGLVEINPPDLAKLQTVIPKDAAVLEPVPLPDRLVLLLVTSSGVSASEVPVTAAQLRQQVEAFRLALQNPRRDPRTAGQALYRWLIAPVEAQLKDAGVRTLLVSPAGCLRYVPFAALHDGKQYLIERMPVGNLTRAGQLALARPARDASGGRVIAISDPDGSLPAARREVETIAGLIPSVKLEGDQATRAALLEGVDGVPFVHLATHGVLDQANPRDSYLVLAGMDGRLTYGQIPGLPLTHAEMVTLSACKTALGARSDGAEIYGLAYQFEKAGAATVVASLWSVADESTSQLMGAFYRALSKTSRVEALRQAQLELERGEKWSHPYYWAPFILIGDVR